MSDPTLPLPEQVLLSPRFEGKEEEVNDSAFVQASSCLLGLPGKDVQPGLVKHSYAAIFDLEDLHCKA